MTNLPAFATHNEASADFTIPQTFDLSLVGIYTVTVRGEIVVPNDEVSNRVEFSEYTFEIWVEPCPLSDHLASPQLTDMYYTVGQPALVSSQYGF